MDKNVYKILVADDEPIECMALGMLLKQNFTGIEVLPGVHNGIDLVTSIRNDSPDIVIVDINMPGINGLEALETVRRQYPDMKILIHSAYSEFEYAKRAFALQAVDYIVKPAQKPVILEIMRKLLDNLDQERIAKNSKETITDLNSEVSRLMEDDIMSSILLGEIDVRTENHFLRSCGGEFRGGLMITVRMASELKKRWEEKEEGHFLESLRRVSTCFSRRWHEDLILFLIPGPGTGEENYTAWVRSLLQGIQAPVYFGVSTWKFMLEELPDALRESASVLLGKKKEGIYFFEYQNETRQAAVFLKSKEEIYNLFLRGEGRKAGELAAKLVCQAGEEGVLMDTLRVQSAIFLHELYEKAVRNASAASEVERVVQNCWKHFEKAEDPAALGAYLQEAVLRLEKHLKDQPDRAGGYVTQALLYIRRFYPENLSVDDVAGRISISSVYLSRLLKQELGETFVEILTRVRIENALLLLADSSLTIREIGEKTGYTNTTYFYKVFKKQTGMTVGEVRRHLAGSVT